MVNAEGAERIVETALRMCGRAVVVRVRQAAGVPPMEVTLRPCLLKVSGETAELLVAASALADVAGLADELFGVAARVVVGDVVWRVVSFAAMECGETVVAWRVQMAR